MKKNYVSPSVKNVKLNTESMMAVSIEIGDNSDTTHDKVADAPEDTYIWDEAEW